MTSRLRIAILSREKDNYSTSRLVEAAKARGHFVRVMDTLRFSSVADASGPLMLYRGKTCRRLDGVIPRIGASITFFGTSVVRQFEQMGVYTLNASHAISVSRDKLRALQILSRHDIGIPRSEFVRSADGVGPAIDRLGGAPVIIKLLEGTQGVGVILADTNKVAQAIIETLQSARQNVLLQRFVKESSGRDLRAFVVGGRVVAAMRRIAKDGEFRSNVHRGGRTETVTLSKEAERTALKAAQIMGLRVAGVDMLESDSGPLVMEVNSSPGLEGIEGATGKDIAGAIIEHMAGEILFPSVDLRQRLSLEKGYAVVETTIRDDSPLSGKTLAALNLRELSVSVLSVRRGETIIPNPHGDLALLAGDVVVCFGKQIALRDLLPSRPR